MKEANQNLISGSCDISDAILIVIDVAIHYEYHRSVVVHIQDRQENQMDCTKKDCFFILGRGLVQSSEVCIRANSVDQPYTTDVECKSRLQADNVEILVPGLEEEIEKNPCV